MEKPLSGANKAFKCKTNLRPNILCKQDIRAVLGAVLFLTPPNAKYVWRSASIFSLFL